MELCGILNLIHVALVPNLHHVFQRTMQKHWYLPRTRTSDVTFHYHATHLLLLQKHEDIVQLQPTFLSSKPLKTQNMPDSPSRRASKVVAQKGCSRPDGSLQVTENDLGSPTIFTLGQARQLRGSRHSKWELPCESQWKDAGSAEFLQKNYSLFRS